MPNIRNANHSATNHERSASTSIVPAAPWSARLSRLTALGTHSVTATCVLWLDLFRNQQRFATRLLDAMHNPINGSRVTQRVGPMEGSATRRTRKVAPTMAPAEFPIKGYDKLTVQEIAAKLERLRDPRQLRTVLAYEAKGKARKGVAVAAEARLTRLAES